MNNIYPTDNKLIFILCDDIHMENTGKVTILGYYGGYNIVFNEKHALPINYEKICMIFNFLDGQGEFSGNIKIYDLNGTEVFDKDFAELSKTTSSESMGVIVKIAPFAITQYGEYKVVFKLDNEIYERKFIITGPN